MSAARPPEGAKAPLGGSAVHEVTSVGARSSAPAIDAVVHREGDDVAMAVVAGLQAGTPLRCWVMDRDEVVRIVPTAAVPMGHKVAMRAIASGERVMKYGCSIGEATVDIAAGDHVHVHNLRSLRW